MPACWIAGLFCFLSASHASPRREITPASTLDNCSPQFSRASCKPTATLAADSPLIGKDCGNGALVRHKSDGSQGKLAEEHQRVACAAGVKAVCDLSGSDEVVVLWLARAQCSLERKPKVWGFQRPRTAGFPFSCWCSGSGRRLLLDLHLLSLTEKANSTLSPAAPTADLVVDYENGSSGDSIILFVLDGGSSTIFGMVIGASKMSRHRLRGIERGKGFRCCVNRCVRSTHDRLQ